MHLPLPVVSTHLTDVVSLNPRLTRGGGLFFAPSRFSAIFPELRADHRQIFSTLQTITFTRPDKRKTC